MTVFRKTWLALICAFFSLQAFSADGQQTTSAPIVRMGNANVRSFDEGWLFTRYGLQADGTSLPEPSGLFKPEAVDSTWQQLDLPHDFAIDGPFRIELAGETGKLPYQGIGWYRKHFTTNPAEGERTYIDFDGAMANAQIWLNGQSDDCL